LGDDASVVGEVYPSETGVDGCFERVLVAVEEKALRVRPCRLRMNLAVTSRVSRTAEENQIAGGVKTREGMGARAAMMT
jgi:hypothetical protein